MATAPGPGAALQGSGRGCSASGGIREILFQDSSRPEVANCNKQELQGWRSEGSKEPGPELGHCSYGMGKWLSFFSGNCICLKDMFSQML